MRLYALQVTEILAFVQSLSRHCALRARGTDCRGSTKGSHNGQLADAMEDVRTVSDLRALRQSKSSSVLRDVDVALRRLQNGRIIPDTTVPNMSIKAAYEAIKATKEGLSNQQLLKELWARARTEPRLQPYLDTVVRLWLIVPAESVVESMASVAKEVFGLHRRLKHESAAVELIVRWNGPEIPDADDLIGHVHATNHFNFRRKHIGKQVEGTVISRHRAGHFPMRSMYKWK